MRTFAVIVFLLLLVTKAITSTATLAWDRAASHTNLAAFVVKQGTTSGSYQATQRVATNITTATVSALKSGTTYFFVVTAENVAGLESDPSNEISYTVPVTITLNLQSATDPSGPWSNEAIFMFTAKNSQAFFRIQATR